MFRIIYTTSIHKIKHEIIIISPGTQFFPKIIYISSSTNIFFKRERKEKQIAMSASNKTVPHVCTNAQQL